MDVRQMIDVSKAKVFGVGLSRTGTVSLTAALKRLGYRAKHYPHLLQVIEMAAKFDALTDIPVIVYMEALDQLYPDARFVLTVRNEETWIASLTRHYSEKPISHIMDWKLWCRWAVYGMSGFEEAHFRQVRVTHEALVRALFESRPGKLLILDVCGGEGYEKLCPFLGTPVVSDPFPIKNQSKHLQSVRNYQL